MSAQPRPSLSRRHVLLGAAGLGAASAGAASLGFLSGCSADTDTPAPAPTVAPGTYGELKLQLRWYNGPTFAGLYLADANGHFRDAGFDKVTFYPGPVDSIEQLVLDKVADIGVSGPITTASFLDKHPGPLRIIGSTTQVTPWGILSLQQGRPIRSVSDFIGKRIGVPQSAVFEAQFDAFCRDSDLDQKSFTLRRIGYEVGPLEDNELDGMWSNRAEEPIRVRMDGFTPSFFGFQEHGFPLPSNSFVTTRDLITTQRPKLKAFLAAAVLGWKDAMKDPAAAAKKTVEVYGADVLLEEKVVTAQIVAYSAMVRNADTDRFGLFTSSQSALDQSIAAIGLTGLDIGAAQLFDLSVLDELYRERPALVNP